MNYDDIIYDTINSETSRKFEIEAAKRDIIKFKKEKRKWVFKCGISGTKCLLLGLAGSIGMTGLLTIGASLTKHSPFIKEDVQRPAYIKTEFDSEGNKKVNKQYKPYEDMNSKVTYYSEWTDMGDNYASVTTTYDLDGYSYDEAKSLLTIKEHPATEPVEGVELTDDISDKSCNHYEATIYEVDSNDYIITPQTKEENAEDITVSFGVPVVPGLFLDLIGLGYLRIGANSPFDEFCYDYRNLYGVSKDIANKKTLVKRLKSKKIS